MATGELRTSSFGSRLDPAFELSAQSEFVDGTTLYEPSKQMSQTIFQLDPGPREKESGAVAQVLSSTEPRERLPFKARDAVLRGKSFQDDGVIGIAHRPKRAGMGQGTDSQNAWNSQESHLDDSEADIVIRQKLVSQKLLGRKFTKGPSAPLTRQLNDHLINSESSPIQNSSSPSGTLAMSKASEPTPWQGESPSRSQSYWTQAPQPISQAPPQPAKQGFSQAGAAFPIMNSSNPQLLQSWLLSQIQQQQPVHPMYWPYLQMSQNMQRVPSWPSQQSASAAPPSGPARNTFNGALIPASTSLSSSQQLERELSSSSLDPLKNTKQASVHSSSNLVPSAVEEEGAPLEALSELVAKDRASQQAVTELRNALEEERQARQRAEERSKDLEGAVAAMTSRARELEDEVSEAMDRARRLEEDSRHAKQRLKDAEKELEGTRRRMQEEAERLVRLERKDVRLAAEMEETQARDQAELEALSEEKRRLEGELLELRKLPVVAEMLREDNDGLRARLQRAEKDRGNLQELVAGIRQSTAELEQANKRATSENDSLRKECNMLRLQLASKDTSLSQLQVALFAGREERTNLHHKLQKLEGALEGSAAPSRRASFGHKTLNLEEEFQLAAARRLDTTFDAFAGGANAFERMGSERRFGGLETDRAFEGENEGRAQDSASASVPGSRNVEAERNSRTAFVPISANPRPQQQLTPQQAHAKQPQPERNAGLNHRANTPSPEKLPPAGVSTPVGRNRAQQLAGSDMRRSLTMDPAHDPGSAAQNERIPSTNGRRGIARPDRSDFGRSTSHSDVRTATTQEQSTLERSHGKPPTTGLVRTDSSDAFSSQSRDRPISPPDAFSSQSRDRPNSPPDAFSTQSRDRPNSPFSRKPNSPSEMLASPRPTSPRMMADNGSQFSPPVSPRFGDVASQKGPGASEPSPGGVSAATKGREPLPFATEVSLQEAMDETAAIESKLMEVSMERSKLESEYAKLPQSAGRTMTERKRKQELEVRIEDLTKKIGWLRMELRERHVLHK